MSINNTDASRSTLGSPNDDELHSVHESEDIVKGEGVGLEGDESDSSGDEETALLESEDAGRDFSGEKFTQDATEEETLVCS